MLIRAQTSPSLRPAQRITFSLFFFLRQDGFIQRIFRTTAVLWDSSLVALLCSVSPASDDTSGDALAILLSGNTKGDTMGFYFLDLSLRSTFYMTSQKTLWQSEASSIPTVLRSCNARCLTPNLRVILFVETSTHDVHATLDLQDLRGISSEMRYAESLTSRIFRVLTCSPVYTGCKSIPFLAYVIQILTSLYLFLGLLPMARCPVGALPPQTGEVPSIVGILRRSCDSFSLDHL